MNPKRILFIIIFVLSSMLAFSQGSPFKGWHSYPHVETTYITKAMFDVAPNMKIGSTNLKNLSNILDQVEIYRNIPRHMHSSKESWSGENMKTYAVNIGKRNSYEMALSLSENNSDIVFYIKRSRMNSNIINDLIMIRLEPQKNQFRNCVVIRLVGKFTFKDIQNIAGGK